jgi:signal transduction histidine kinase
LPSPPRNSTPSGITIFADKDARANERLEFFAHELLNHLNSATLALTAIKAGSVGLSGATGAVLDRSWVALRRLIDRSLAEARTTAGIPVQHRLFSLADFIAEVQLAASLEAQVNKCTLTVSYVDSKLAVDADRELLLSALGNLLQNAFKFTHQGSEVLLKVYASADRILIEVEDKCGGLHRETWKKCSRPSLRAARIDAGSGWDYPSRDAASRRITEL